MKGLRIYLFVIILLFCANDTFSQFYSIEKKREVVKVLSPTDNNKDMNITFKTLQDDDSESGINIKTSSFIEDKEALLSRMRESLLFSSPLERDTLFVTSYYGMRKDPFSGKRKFHAGTDFQSNAENVFSMMPGRIKDIGYKKSLGNYIEIEHGDFSVLYGHLFSVIGRKGDNLRAGQSVGISGSTGKSTGDHLHISMKYKGKRIDPLPIVRYINSYARELQQSIIIESDSIKYPD